MKPPSALAQFKIILQRILARFWLKCIGSTVAINAFFVFYFYTLEHPLFPSREMPVLGIDQWVPVLPESVWVYYSLWVYICLPSTLMRKANELGYYLMGATLLSLAGLSFFYFLPSMVPSWGIDWTQYPELLLLKVSDASGNACPSLHVAFAVYAALWFDRVLSLMNLGRLSHRLNWLWCVLIVLSTMTTKQHVFIDVLCGAALGSMIYYLNNKIAQKAKFAALSES